jgi:hypothetical protein
LLQAVQDPEGGRCWFLAAVSTCANEAPSSGDKFGHVLAIEGTDCRIFSGTCNGDDLAAVVKDRVMFGQRAKQRRHDAFDILSHEKGRAFVVVVCRCH